MDASDDPLGHWYRRVMTALVAEAERGHGDQVQRRSWAAAAAAAFAKPKDVAPLAIGAQTHLESLRDDPSVLTRDFVALSNTLPWTASTRTDPSGDKVGLVDLFECLDMDLAGAGVMFLAPGAEYPEHQHQPAEVYIVLHGSRRWRFGGSDRYRLIEEGEVLSNSSMDLHGVQAGPDPLLALWVLMDDRY